MSEEFAWTIGSTKLEDYYREARVGEGTYGVVYRAVHTPTGRVVALKRIRLENDEGCPSTAIREIAILKELEHTNVMRLLDVIHTPAKITLVLDFLPYDLKQIIDQYKGAMPMMVVKSFLYQLLRGVAYIHNKRVLHRDIKPQNLLVSDRGELKLGDFGLARAFGIPVRSYTHEVVTLWYRAPDVLLGNRRYGTPIDLWSIGVVFAEMVNGKPLFPGRTERDEIVKIFQLLGTPDRSTWPGAFELPGWKNDFPSYKRQNLSEMFPRLEPAGIDLMTRLLEYNPESRITARNALHHPFFKDLVSMTGTAPLPAPGANGLATNQPQPQPAA